MIRLGVWHIPYSFRDVQGLLLASAHQRHSRQDYYHYIKSDKPSRPRIIQAVSINYKYEGSFLINKAITTSDNNKVLNELYRMFPDNSLTEIIQNFPILH